MRHDTVKMPMKTYMAEHARLAKVLKDAKTTAAAKELGRQKKEVMETMAKHRKSHMMMKRPMMIKGMEY
jgi:hypothetical protein